eukprot:g19262.t2
MWHDEKVWPHLAPEERQKVRGYAAQYKRITGEEALDPNQPAVRSALSRSDLRPWLKMSGYADTGREAPYFLQPDTGEVIHLPEADEQSVQTDAFGYAEQRDIRSMSILEEDLEALETGAERHQGLRSQRAKKRKETARSARLGPQEVIEYMVGDEDESSGAEEDPNVQKEIRKKRQGMDSYCPGGKRAHRPEHNKLHGEPDEENLGGRQGELGRNVPSEPVAFTVQDVLVGYGDLKPGVVPWQIFKRGTIFLAISWAPGTRDGPKTSASGSGREMGVNGGELDEEVKSEERTKQQREYLEKLPWLPGGEKVKTHWPIHSVAAEAHGLGSSRFQRRQKRFGPNPVPEPRPRCPPLTPPDLNGYQVDLQQKVDLVQDLLADLSDVTLDVVPSPELLHYRHRVRFGLRHGEEEALDWSVVDPESGEWIVVKAYPLASVRINRLMSELREALAQEKRLRWKAFEVELLSNTKGEALALIMYHRRLDPEDDLPRAQALAKELDAKVVLRAKGQRMAGRNSFLVQENEVAGRRYSQRLLESSFFQANLRLNQQMQSWVTGELTDLAASGGDLLEIYCGNGNFTLPAADAWRTALSCDPLGQNIVVADDFKIYAAKLRQRTVEQMDESSRLRGGGATTERHNLEANFEPQPRRCQCGMHGQQLKALQSAGLARAWDDAVGV